MLNNYKPIHLYFFWNESQKRIGIFLCLSLDNIYFLRFLDNKKTNTIIAINGNYSFIIKCLILNSINY